MHDKYRMLGRLIFDFLEGRNILKLEPTKKVELVKISELLLSWFHENQRDLPWRRDYSPYKIWIAEIMLQQTQVKTVVPYYRRWMKRFRNIEAVARASAEELLRHWEGLGYYARVKNIHETARILVNRYGGRFPQDHSEILGLPGIGPYTAGAIMSLAFNEGFPVVDGNVERIFSRLFNITTAIKGTANRRFLWGTATELIPTGRAREFNQALMELGALICVPRNPACEICPIVNHCESFKLDVVHARPVAGPGKKITPIEVSLGVLVRQEKVFIQKRPENGLMGGLWEFPGGKLKPGEKPEEALVREFCEELDLDVCCLDKIALIRHSYTSFRVALHAFFCRLTDPSQSPKLRAAVAARWVTTEQLDHLAFPAANRKLIKMLQT